MQYVFPHIRCWSKDLFTTVVLCGLWVYLFSCECITPTRLCPAAPAFPFQLLLQLGYYLCWQIRCGTKLFHTYIDKIHVCWKTSVKGSNNEWGPPAHLSARHCFLFIFFWHSLYEDLIISTLLLLYFLLQYELISMIWSCEVSSVWRTDGWRRCSCRQQAAAAGLGRAAAAAADRPLRSATERSSKEGDTPPRRGGGTREARTSERHRAGPSVTSKGGGNTAFSCVCRHRWAF